jgi:hypothetical protein
MSTRLVSLGGVLSLNFLSTTVRSCGHILVAAKTALMLDLDAAEA